jgi:hypothetical protein
MDSFALRPRQDDPRHEDTCSIYACRDPFYCRRLDKVFCYRSSGAMMMQKDHERKWLSIGALASTFWLHSGYILATFWLHSGGTCKKDLARRFLNWNIFLTLPFFANAVQGGPSSNVEPLPSVIGKVAAAPSSPVILWVSPYTRQSYREQLQRSVGGVCAAHHSFCIL